LEKEKGRMNSRPVRRRIGPFLKVATGLAGPEKGNRDAIVELFSGVLSKGI